MGTENRLASESGTVRHKLGEVVLALFFAMAPSYLPDWRADPGLRTVAVLPIGEPVVSWDKAYRG